MAAIRENTKNGKTVSYRFTTCLGRDVFDSRNRYLRLRAFYWRKRMACFLSDGCLLHAGDKLHWGIDFSVQKRYNMTEKIKMVINLRGVRGGFYRGTE